MRKDSISVVVAVVVVVALFVSLLHCCPLSALLSFLLRCLYCCDVFL